MFYARFMTQPDFECMQDDTQWVRQSSCAELADFGMVYHLTSLDDLPKLKAIVEQDLEDYVEGVKEDDGEVSFSWGEVYTHKGFRDVEQLRVELYDGTEFLAVIVMEEVKAL